MQNHNICEHTNCHAIEQQIHDKCDNLIYMSSCCNFGPYEFDGGGH